MKQLGPQLRKNNLYLVIVNRNNKIDYNFIFDVDLVSTLDIEGEVVFLEKKTLEQYNKLKDFLFDKGFIIGISSAYRSVEEQKEIYEDFCIRYGEEYAKSVVSPVRCSEHHTGLAIDINLCINGKWPNGNYELMDQESELIKIHKYLHKYGFILRYPKGKENITGYNYEPWHIRYVGKYAETIYEENITLEEYLEKEDL